MFPFECKQPGSEQFQASDQWFYLFDWMIAIWIFFFCLMVWQDGMVHFVGPMMCPDVAWPEKIC